MKRVVLAVLVVCLAATACGDNKKSAASKTGVTIGDAGSGTTLPPNAVGPAGTGAGTSGGDQKALGGGAGTPGSPGAGSPSSPSGPSGAGGAGGTTTTTRPPYPVKMHIERTCVRKGAGGDTQGLVVSTSSEDMIGYSTQYSDGSNELTNQSYKSGSGYGKADTKGNYHVQWKVPDTAPLGTAKLLVIADARHHPPLEFKVVGPTDSC